MTNSVSLHFSKALGAPVGLVSQATPWELTRMDMSRLPCADGDLTPVLRLADPWFRQTLDQVLNDEDYALELVTKEGLGVTRWACISTQVEVKILLEELLYTAHSTESGLLSPDAAARHLVTAATRLIEVWATLVAAQRLSYLEPTAVNAALQAARAGDDAPHTDAQQVSA